MTFILLNGYLKSSQDNYAIAGNPVIFRTTTTSSILKATRKWNITICAKMYNSLPYVFEWIEFHRLQGVDRFVIYDDESDDDTLLLDEFYAKRKLRGLIEIVPIRSVINKTVEILRRITDHTRRQEMAVQDCKQRYSCLLQKCKMRQKEARVQYIQWRT